MRTMPDLIMIDNGDDDGDMSYLDILLSCLVVLILIAIFIAHM